MMKKISKIVAFIMVFLLASIINVDAARPVVASKTPVARLLAPGIFVKEANAPEGDANILNSYAVLSEADDEVQLYCVERTNGNLGSADTLKRSGKIMDFGISYILQQDVSSSYDDVTFTGGYCSNTARNIELLDIWVKQNAIWSYLEPSFTFINKLNFQQEVAITDESSQLCTVGTDKNTFIDTYVKPLVNEAKAAVDPATSVVNFTFEKGWTADGDVYKTNLIKPVVSSPYALYTSFALSLVDAPEGTKVYKKGGEELTGNMAINAGEEIYITVPADKAKKAPKFSLKATTTINYLAAYEYVDDRDNITEAERVQSSVLLDYASKDVSGVLELSIAPDTASSISAAMYFIGLLILLSGAGIIYANVRPRKEEI